MKFNFFFILVLSCSYMLLAQDASEGNKRTKNTKQSKLAEKYKLKDSVVFNASKLDSLWNIEKANDQFIYDPDSMRQTSTYTKYIFSFSEFKNAGGNINSKSDIKIYYTITDTQKKNHTPSDPSMPSPSGGFSYITHTCKIVKVEAN